MAGDPVTAIASAIDGISRMIANILATREIRHMKAAIDAAERYIDVNEGFGDNADLSEKDKLNLLRKFRKRFKTFN